MTREATDRTELTSSISTLHINAVNPVFPKQVRACADQQNPRETLDLVATLAVRLREVATQLNRPPMPGA